MLANFNMDLRQRVVIDTNKLQWADSPLAEVQRMMLEREYAESGRATSLVRYAAGSHFTSHHHSGGEEFMVLEGVFSNEFGDLGPGMYIRNPVGSRHRPSSESGCTIFVKLSQMDPDDQDYVRIDTNGTDCWQPGLTAGLSVLPLHHFGGEHTSLVKWEPGTRFVSHCHPGGEEILVLEGVFEDEFGRYPKGTWIRNPAGSIHQPFSNEGCKILVKTGHLNWGAATTAKPAKPLAATAV